MAYRKKRSNPKTGLIQTGTVLDVVESSEPLIRLKLEDGTLVRLKISVIEVMKMDETDANGKPIYDFNASLAATIVPIEEQLDG